MSHYKKSEGLYTKTESPITESVEQTEGLYKKTKVASVNIHNPNESEQAAIEELNKNSIRQSRILKE